MQEKMNKTGPKYILIHFQTLKMFNELSSYSEKKERKTNVFLEMTLKSLL